MAKRKNIVNSDDDVTTSSQASKRARTEDSDDLDQDLASSPRRERKPVINGKGKGKAEEYSTDEDEEGDFPRDEEPDEEAEKRFEEDHGEAIRRKLEQRRNTIGVCSFLFMIGTSDTIFRRVSQNTVS